MSLPYPGPPVPSQQLISKLSKATRDGKSGQWLDDDVAVRQALGISRTFDPYKGPLRGVMAARHKGLVSTAGAWKVMQKENPFSWDHFYCDLNPSVKRQPWTKFSHKNGCITTTSLIFSFALGRLLIPKELLSAHLLPTNVMRFDSLPPKEVKRAAGEAMCCASVGTAIVVALMLLHDHKKAQAKKESDETAAATVVSDSD